MTQHSPTVLIILDGWGYRADEADNAIAQARSPNWDRLWTERPRCLISGSGLDVGLPSGQMGNSEVGHMNLGAGRVIHQDFTRISSAIADGSVQDNAALKNAMETVTASGKALHLFALASPGGVHSHEDHIHAIIDMARNIGAPKIYLHAFLDGRDVPPKSAEPSLASLHHHLTDSGEGGIASITGRYYAMDRDNRWDRVEPAYDLLTSGSAEYESGHPVAALHAAYERGETDEFVKPTAIRIGGNHITIQDGDAVIFMNFRADRARQISRAFTDDAFNDFERQNRPRLSHYVTLTEYAEDIDAEVAFEPEDVHNSLGEYVSGLGLRQLRLAETEKYAHVTFFFSGGREQVFSGEDRLLIPSPRVATYDLQPEMSAVEVTDELIKAITGGQYELIVCNYANGDMVGHTGVMSASIKAVECIDQCLGRIEEALEKSGGQCLITADHGNVEQLVDHSTNQPHTAHTSELVPLVYIGPQDICLEQNGGVLSDVAPTLLTLMGLNKPAEMTGKSLVNSISKVAATN